MASCSLKTPSSARTLSTWVASEDWVPWSWDWSSLSTAGESDDEGDVSAVEGAEVDATGGSC